MNAMTEIKPLNFHRHAQDLRETVAEAPVLASRSQEQDGGRGADRAVHELFDRDQDNLLRVVFDQRDIQRPFFCSGAEIQLSGKLVCRDLTEKSGITHSVVVYESTDELSNRDMRELAERLKLRKTANGWNSRRPFSVGSVADHRVDHIGKRLN